MSEASERVAEFVRQYKSSKSKADLIYDVWFDPEAEPIALTVSDLEALIKEATHDPR